MVTFIVMITLLCFSIPDKTYAAKRSVIVGFHRTPGASEKALIRGAKGHIRRSFRRVRAMSVTLDEKEIEKIMRSSNVAYVEEDAVMSVVDPVLSQEYIDSWGVSHIGAETAHASGNTGKGVKIAVIDTGIDYTHDDLKDNYRGGYDFVFDDYDPYDDSWNSHGTHIAGIIAAKQNDSGVVGVAPEADIYALKVLDRGGFGLLSWIVAAIEWSIENDMDVINLSLGGGKDFQSLRDACDSAYSAGVLVIAAAGNTYGGEVAYPAAYDSVIAVSGTDAYDMEGFFAPLGPEIELVAPGIDILSSIANFDYDTISGTSQAAAHVTGTAALLYAYDPEDVNGDNVIDNVDVRSMLRSTAIDLGEEGPDDVFGYGLVDASAASFSVFEPVHLNLVRTYSRPRHDMETVSLSGGVFEINVKNNGLRGIKVHVFEGGIFQRDLSRGYRFHNKKRHFFRNISRRLRPMTIDARETEYDLYLTPYGRPGTSADVLITE
jgi:subtilisin